MALLVAVAAVVASFYVGPFRAVVISGESMEPLYESGDLVLTRATDDHQTGDIVLYRVEGDGQVIHRIVDLDDDGFVTRGDNRVDDDLWRPTADTIVGQPMLHLPGVGSAVSRLREPLPFAAAVTAGALLVPSRRRRRDRGNTVSNPRCTDTRTVEHLATAGAVAVLAAIALSSFAWRTPTTESVEVTTTIGDRRIDLLYAADNQPSALYPDGQLGPVAPGDPAEPIFRPLVDEMRVQVVAPAPEGAMGLDGTWAVEVRTRSLDGWERTEVLAPIEALPADGLDAEIAVPIEDLLATVDQIAEETESSSAVTIDIVAAVETTGRLEGTSFDRTDEATLSFALNGGVLTPAEDRSLVAPIDEVRNVEQSRDLGGVLGWLPVASGRIAGPLLGVVGALFIGLATRKLRVTGSVGEAGVDRSRPTPSDIDLTDPPRLAAAAGNAVQDRRLAGLHGAVLLLPDRPTASSVNGNGPR